MRNFTNASILIRCIIVFSTPLLAAETKFYFGEALTYSPDGHFYGSSIKLIKRTLDPDKNKIFEDILYSEKDGKIVEDTLDISVKETKFSVSVSSGAYKGTGELYGAPWKWSGLSAKFELAGGAGTIRVSDFFSEEEALAISEYYSPDGKLVTTTKSRLQVITEFTYKLLHKKLAQ